MGLLSTNRNLRINYMKIFNFYLSMLEKSDDKKMSIDIMHSISVLVNLLILDTLLNTREYTIHVPDTKEATSLCIEALNNPEMDKLEIDYIEMPTDFFDKLKAGLNLENNPTFLIKLVYLVVYVHEECIKIFTDKGYSVEDLTATYISNTKYIGDYSMEVSYLYSYFNIAELVTRISPIDVKNGIDKVTISTYADIVHWLKYNNVTDMSNCNYTISADTIDNAQYITKRVYDLLHDIVCKRINTLNIKQEDDGSLTLCGDRIYTLGIITETHREEFLAVLRDLNVPFNLL